MNENWEYIDAKDALSRNVKKLILRSQQLSEESFHVVRKFDSLLLKLGDLGPEALENKLTPSQQPEHQQDKHTD